MSDIEWLREREFRHAGHWSAPDAKLQRLAPIEAHTGIYAFVVDGTIVYIGKATRLRSRLRQYNRALGPATPRGFRQVHRGLQDSWNGQVTIDVWIHRHDSAGALSPRHQEAAWITEKNPPWNNDLRRAAEERPQDSP